MAITPQRGPGATHQLHIRWFSASWSTRILTFARSHLYVEICAVVGTRHNAFPVLPSIFALIFIRSNLFAELLDMNAKLCVSTWPILNRSVFYDESFLLRRKYHFSMAGFSSRMNKPFSVIIDNFRITFHSFHITRRIFQQARGLTDRLCALRISKTYFKLIVFSQKDFGIDGIDMFKCFM